MQPGPSVELEVVLGGASHGPVFCVEVTGVARAEAAGREFTLTAVVTDGAGRTSDAHLHVSAPR